MFMRTIVIAALGFSALAGCNRAESPAEVNHDVAKAQGDADARVAEKAGDAAKTEADATHEVAIATAEGQLKVGTEKCEALAGTAQSDCKKRVNAAYETAKADADTARDRQRQ